jgi:SAM-dependent methyltransferase
MQISTLKTLDNSQLETFDTDYINDKRWKIIQENIDRDFPKGKFRFLDIGGGNGLFADKLLLNYPNSEGTVLDNSELLIQKNKVNSRKVLICDSVESLSLLNQKYDIIFFNWLLHHLVGNSYTESKNNILSALNSAVPLLSEYGRISIYENMYDGLILDSLPSSLIYNLTSNRAIAQITRKMGANTAGVGVCFLSKNQWISTLKKTDLELIKYSDDDKWSIPLTWNVFLHIESIRCGHFWLMKSI